MNLDARLSKLEKQIVNPQDKMTKDEERLHYIKLFSLPDDALLFYDTKGDLTFDRIGAPLCSNYIFIYESEESVKWTTHKNL